MAVVNAEVMQFRCGIVVMARERRVDSYSVFHVSPSSTHRCNTEFRVLTRNRSRSTTIIRIRDLFGLEPLVFYYHLFFLLIVRKRGLYDVLAVTRK